MSPEKKAHITVLHKNPSCFAPYFRCLTLGVSTTPVEAEEEARKIIRMLPTIEGYMFVEEDGHPATLDLDCEKCNNRESTRLDLLGLYT